MMEPDSVRANLKFQKDLSGAHSCVDGLTNHVQTWEVAEPPLGVKKQLRELVLRASVTDSVTALLMLASALGSLCYGLAQVDLVSFVSRPHCSLHLNPSFISSFWGMCV